MRTTKIVTLFLSTLFTVSQLAAQEKWRRQLEAQPSRFMRAVLPDALRGAAAQLGKFVGEVSVNFRLHLNTTGECREESGSGHSGFRVFSLASCRALV